MQTRAVFILGLACLTGCGQLAVLPNGSSTKNTANGAGTDSSAADSNSTGNAGDANSTGTGTAGDANNIVPIATDPNAAVPSAGRTDWLSIKGNTFYRNGKVWIGRGVTIHDTRSCDTCTSFKPNVAELKRRIDDAVTNWHVNFFRLLLEQYPAASYTDAKGNPTGVNRVQWDTLANDPSYLHDIQDIVQYIGKKQGVYVMVSLWKDPGFTKASSTVQGGVPGAESAQLAATLAKVFQNDAQVLLGVANEPESNYDGAFDASCVAAMNMSVAAIRKVEDAAPTPNHHIVAVQGTAQWGRTITYYVNHPIATDNGDNVAYETHPYTPQANFKDSLLTPAKTLPVIIGEFAPADPYMTVADAKALMTAADAANIPWVAWDFHMQCNTDAVGTNMLLMPTDQDKTKNPSQCIPNTALTPTPDWGVAVQTHLKSVQ